MLTYCARLKEIRYFLRKKNPFCDHSRSKEIPETDQVSEIAPSCAPISELPSNIL